MTSERGQSKGTSDRSSPTRTRSSVRETRAITRPGGAHGRRRSAGRRSECGPQVSPAKRRKAMRPIWSTPASRPIWCSISLSDQLNRKRVDDKLC